jgi:hypothetical protein
VSEGTTISWLELDMSNSKHCLAPSFFMGPARLAEIIGIKEFLFRPRNRCFVNIESFSPTKNPTNLFGFEFQQPHAMKTEVLCCCMVCLDFKSISHCTMRAPAALPQISIRFFFVQEGVHFSGAKRALTNRAYYSF